MNTKFQLRFGRLCLMIGVLGLAFATFASAVAQGTSSVTVTTASGPVVGTESNKVRTFLGIPYAEPPVGELRWAKPRPHAAWTKPLDATRFGEVCPQPAGLTEASLSTASTNVKGAEDCLFLNVYASATAKSRPVMVWIHGGSFLSGSGSDYDGSVLARDNDLVVVTVNYRLGALGFLAHPALSAAGGGESGNYGLLDQQLALQWVQANIAAFGGDPKNVTIFGESAGGSSVCYQVASPTAKGLFGKAILQSGVCMIDRGFVTMTDAASTGKTFATALGCDNTADTLACLRSKTIKQIGGTPSSSVGITGLGSWGAVYGDSVLPLKLPQAFEQGDFNRVPIINGTNHDEGRLFAWMNALANQPITRDYYIRAMTYQYGSDAAKVLAQYPASSYETPALAYSAVLTDAWFACSNLKLHGLLAKHTTLYAYEFNDPEAVFALKPLLLLTAPDLKLGSYHASEIGYIFRAAWSLSDPRVFTPKQESLSKQMSGYWVTFAMTGSPNASGFPQWKPFTADKEYIQALTPDGIQQNQGFAKDHHCDFWLALGK